MSTIEALFFRPRFVANALRTPVNISEYVSLWENGKHCSYFGMFRSVLLALLPLEDKITPFLADTDKFD